MLFGVFVNVGTWDSLISSVDVTLGVCRDMEGVADADRLRLAEALGVAVMLRLVEWLRRGDGVSVRVCSGALVSCFVHVTLTVCVPETVLVSCPVIVDVGDSLGLGVTLGVGVSVNDDVGVGSCVRVKERSPDADVVSDNIGSDTVIVLVAETSSVADDDELPEMDIETVEESSDEKVGVGVGGGVMVAVRVAFSVSVGDVLTLRVGVGGGVIVAVLVGSLLIDEDDDFEVCSDIVAAVAVTVSEIRVDFVVDTRRVSVPGVTL